MGIMALRAAGGSRFMRKKKSRFSLDFLNRPINRGIFHIKAKKVGQSPGTLIHVGKQKVERPLLSVIDYDQGTFQVYPDLAIDDILAFKESRTVSWINLSGIHDISVIERFGARFDIHPLALEDILNTHHRPKIEEFDHYSLIILKMLFFDETTQSIDIEQVSIILGDNYVITFQEREGDVFDGVRERLQRSNGRLRQRGSDYLTYALLDSIVDSYFHILEKVGDRLAILEEELIDNPGKDSLAKVHHYKRELMLLRKSVWPLREVISELHKEESDRITEGTQIYLRDLYDHSVQVLDTVEIFRDSISGLQDLYMSSVSNRMNEIMKVLTIMASIFIPLTFIAGIYGMNFENMPELHWRWGYPAVWLVMGTCLVGMIIYFKRKNWL